MRYLMVRYLRKPNGQMDELVEVGKRLKPRDYSYAAVILDFRSKKVEKAHLDGVTLPRDFDRIRNFYHKHYSQLIDNLEAQNQPPELVKSDRVSESD